MNEHTTTDTDLPNDAPPALLMGRWQMRPLGELAEWRAGDLEAKSDFTPGDLLFSTAEHIASGGMPAHISRNTLDQSSIAPKGSVLMVSRGATLTERLPVCLTPEEAAVHQDIAIAIPKNGVDGAFLLQMLRVRAQQLLALAGEGRKIELPALCAVSVPLPPLAEQRTIAETLAQLGEVIAETEAMIAKLSAIGRGLLRDLAARGLDAKGKVRDPFPAGRMPKGWSRPSPEAEIDPAWRALFDRMPPLVPPLAEQQRIVALLLQQAEAVAAEEQLLAKLRTLARALDDELLAERSGS